MDSLRTDPVHQRLHCQRPPTPFLPDLRPHSSTLETFFALGPCESPLPPDKLDLQRLPRGPAGHLLGEGRVILDCDERARRGEGGLGGDQAAWRREEREGEVGEERVGDESRGGRGGVEMSGCGAKRWRERSTDESETREERDAGSERLVVTHAAKSNLGFRSTSKAGSTRLRRHTPVGQRRTRRRNSRRAKGATLRRCTTRGGEGWRGA